MRGWENMEIIQLDTVNSTNSYAKLNIDTLHDRTVIHALHQTSGRGRLNRSWVDLGEDNLFMTIVLKPSDTFNEIYPNLTQYLSVCLCKVLEKYGLNPQIKWPNDVLINGKKIAGILSETVIQGSKFKGIILGIGVNLNAKQEDTNSIPDRVVTSLNLELNKKVDRQAFLQKLLEEFFANYDEFLSKGFIFIKDFYIKKICFLNKEIKIQVFNKIKEGLAQSVNNNGELVLLDKENKEFVLTIGDIL